MCFNSRWELDGVATWKVHVDEHVRHLGFNSRWELDGVATPCSVTVRGITYPCFNSRWELDGVATSPVGRGLVDVMRGFQFPMGIRRSCYSPRYSMEWPSFRGFQFPMGIRRSCYSVCLRGGNRYRNPWFQFPMGIRRSCYDLPWNPSDADQRQFQFPMGIRRSCYSAPREPLVARGLDTKIAHLPIPADVLPDPVSSTAPVFLSSCRFA